MALPYTVDDPFLQDDLDELDRRTTTLTGSTGDIWHSVGDTATGLNTIFFNGFANYNVGYPPAGFIKDADGVVHLRGLIGTPVTGDVGFYLPLGYRPSNYWGTPSRLHFASAVAAGTSVVAIDGIDGAVRLPGGVTWVDLSTIHYRTDA